MNVMQLKEEIERFYSDFEKNIRNYKRPVDYRERYIRVLNADSRNRVELNKEGLTSGDNNNDA